MSNRIHATYAALASACLVAMQAAPAAAQGSDAGSNTASVTVASTPITVTGVQPLLFGTHFASEGLVENGGDAEWFVDGPQGATVDLSFSVLPGSLTDGSNTVPLDYGSTSLGVYCDDGAGNVVGQFVDPQSGFTGCLLPAGGSVLVELGAGAGGDGKVRVDLTGAPDGTYTAIIELTATIN